MTAFADDDDDDWVTRALDELFSIGTWEDGPDGSRVLRLTEDPTGEERTEP